MAEGNQPQDNTSNVIIKRDDTNLSRRKYMGILTALAGSPTLAGCMGNSGDSGSANGGGSNSSNNLPASNGTNESSPSGEPTQGGHLQTTLEAPVNHFNLHINGLMVASITGLQVVEKLFRPNKDLQMEGVLAKDVSISNDGLTWEIAIQENATFHPPYKRNLKAEDIVRNLEYVKNPENGSFRSIGVEAVESMEATGDHTLKMQLSDQKASFRPWLGGYFGIPIFSPEALEEGNIREHPVGSGPFVFENWQPGDKIQLAKFDDYWQTDKPYVDKITFRPITEASVMMTELTDGNIDMLRSTPADYIQQLKNNNSVNVQQANGVGYRALHINPANQPKKNRAQGTPTTNPQVRQAILEAIDRTAMVDIIESGLGTATQNYFPNNHPWHTEYEPYSMKANPEKARSLLKKAGYGNGSVPVTIISQSSDPTLRQLGTITRDALLQAGFEPSLQEYEAGNWVTKAEAFQYDINVNSYAGWFHPTEIKAWIHPDGLTQMNYETENADRIFQLFKKLEKLTIEDDKATPLNEELQKLLIDDAALVPLYHSQKIQTTRNSVENFEIHPFHIAYRLESVYLNN